MKEVAIFLVCTIFSVFLIHGVQAQSITGEATSDDVGLTIVVTGPSSNDSTVEEEDNSNEPDGEPAGGGEEDQSEEEGESFLAPPPAAEISIPDRCNVGFSCEVISGCRAIVDSDSVFTIGSPPAKARKLSCSYEDCSFSYIDYEACTTGDSIIEPEEDIILSPESDFVEVVKGKTKSVVEIVNEQDDHVAELVYRVEDEKEELYITFGSEPDENTCFNSVRDGNEEGVDCGGDCKVCKRQSKFYYYVTWIFWALLILLICFYVAEDVREQRHKKKKNNWRRLIKYVKNS